MAETKEELKSFLMRVKEESEKASLKLNVQKTKIMASGPITSWQIDGVAMETKADFIFLGSKITADNDCSHEIKRGLLLGRKTMTKLNSVLKSRDITLLTKICIVKAMVFLVVVHMWELDHKEVWVPKNWCSWILVLEKARESLGLQGDQTSQSKRKSTLNIHWKDWCWSSNTLATWCKDLTHSKDPGAVKDWGLEETGQREDEIVGQHHWLNENEFQQTPGDSEGLGSLLCCSPMRSQRVGHE